MKDLFSDIIQIIKNARSKAIKAVNSELISLYWNIGEYISKKVKLSEWGQSVVRELAQYIQTSEPEIKGFSDKNLWRMKQFYESYKESPKVSTLLREISWPQYGPNLKESDQAIKNIVRFINGHN